MRTKENKKGISLIVLIVTIIVVIILAAVVILTISKNNPIESAKEARFKEDIRTFQDELALAVSKEYADAGGHRDEKITTADFDEIKRYIPSFSEKYRDKFVIQDDELKYTNKLDEKEKEYAQSISIKEKVKLLPDEYQQVEYIESTGTQYINTLFSATEKTSVLVNFKGNGVSNQYGILASRYPYYSIYFYQGHFIFSCATNTNTSERIITIDSNNTNRNVIYLKEGILYYNNNLISDYVLNSEIYRNNSLDLGLFCRNTNNTFETRGSLKLFECLIWDNSKLVRNYIPCYSRTNVVDLNGNQCPSGTKGLYDTVEGKFYTNQGDPTKGDFIPGPDVD